jgi:hypothetical protein
MWPVGSKSLRSDPSFSLFPFHLTLVLDDLALLHASLRAAHSPFTCARHAWVQLGTSPATSSASTRPVMRSGSWSGRGAVGSQWRSAHLRDARAPSHRRTAVSAVLNLRHLSRDAPDLRGGLRRSSRLEKTRHGSAAPLRELELRRRAGRSVLVGRFQRPERAVHASPG